MRCLRCLTCGRGFTHAVLPAANTENGQLPAAFRYACSRIFSESVLSGSASSAECRPEEFQDIAPHPPRKRVPGETSPTRSVLLRRVRCEETTTKPTDVLQKKIWLRRSLLAPCGGMYQNCRDPLLILKRRQPISLIRMLPMRVLICRGTPPAGKPSACCAAPCRQKGSVRWLTQSRSFSEGLEAR